MRSTRCSVGAWAGIAVVAVGKIAADVFADVP